MNFEIRFIGKKIVQLKVNSWSGDATISEDVSDLFGNVNETLIENLREIANEIEAHNERKLAQQKKVIYE